MLDDTAENSLATPRCDRRPPRRGRHRSVERSRGTRSLLLGGLSVAAVVALLASTVSTAPAGTLIVNGVDGPAATVSRAIGAPLADHAYGQLTGAVPVGKMVTMDSTVSWRAVAGAQSGSATYAHIARWADSLKSRGGRILFAFEHEPEVRNASAGTAASYIAAFRRVEGIFKARGVANVEYTWQMTAYSFRVAAADHRAAKRWYPGDSYVDYIGADAFNWYNCGPGNGQWVPLSKVISGALAFSVAHRKQLVLAEWASQADSRNPTRRAAWLREAHNMFVAKRSSIRAVFYFHTTIRLGCHWLLLSASDRKAFGDIARDSKYFTAG